MNKTVLLVLCATSFLGSAFSQTLGSYTFSSGSTCPTIDKSVDSQPTNGSFSTVDLASNSPSCEDASGAFVSQSWTNSETPLISSYAIDYTLTANSGYKANATQVSVDVMRSTQGPDSGAFYISVDGGAFTRQGSVFSITTTSSTFSTSFDLTSADQGTITVKVAFWSAGNSGANSKVTVDNLALVGHLHQW